MDRTTIDLDPNGNRVIDRGLEKKSGRPGSGCLQQHEFIDHGPKITGFRPDRHVFAMIPCGLEDGIEGGEDRPTMSFDEERGGTTFVWAFSAFGE